MPQAERHRALLLAVLFAAAGSAASEPGPSGPTVRVGLGEPRSRVTVACSGAFRIVDPERPGKVLGEAGAAASVAFLPAGDPVPPRPLFRVMVLSTRDEAWARELERWLTPRLPDQEVSLQWNPERDAWRLYAGAFPSREEAAILAPDLVAMGFHSPWITERTWEEAPATGGEVRIDGSMGSYSRLALVADGAGSVFLLNGHQYRGSLEILPGAGGGLQAVNVLPMEDYLRGVVPREMGPLQFPRIEALKAQAVAARTYALRSMGLFSHLGYDLCDGPRCQAYGGAGIEHPMTDRAVRETRGEVVVWNGRPIRAFYTASCGGHTEDVSEIFIEETEPYLRAVPCPEASEAGRETPLAAPVEVFPAEDGRPWNDELKRASTCYPVDPEIGHRPYGWGRPDEDELSEIRRAVPEDAPAAAWSLLSPVRTGEEPALSRVETHAMLFRILGGTAARCPGTGHLPTEFPMVRIPPLWREGSDDGPGSSDWIEERAPAEVEGPLFSRTGAAEIESLVPLRYGRSGRITELLVKTGGGDIVLKGIRVRWGLGLREIPRGWKEQETGGDGWTFEGGGWGHGVGLCQRGAFKMALGGRDHSEILLYYYSEPARIEEAW